MRSKKLTKRWLDNHGACQEAVDAFSAQTETDVVKLLKRCMKADRFDWANWLIVRKMRYKQYVSYTIFAAEQGVGLYEKKYPSDKRPRHAIEAARRCIKNSTQNNRDAAYSAADSAADAAADAARSAAYSAADSAAYSAAYSAAARSAAYSAAARSAAYKRMKKKILNHGIKLLEGG